MTASGTQSTPNMPRLKPTKELAKERRMELFCQVVLALVQLLLVIGAVYLKQALSAGGDAIQPVIFALVREAGAGAILLVIAYSTTGLLPEKEHLLQVAGLGAALFLNQLLYIEGVSLSGVIVASCIQPAIPVFTAALAVILRVEPTHWRKLTGIALAVLGSVIMVAGNSKTAGTDTHSAYGAWSMLLGNVCLVGNTVAMAFYYLQAKKLQGSYPAVCLVAWAYVAAAVCMGTTAAVTVPASSWYIPSSAWGPVLYWILVCSVFGYYILTWTTKHLPASQVAAFQCLQPFYGGVLGYMFLDEHVKLADASALLILAGLACVTLPATSAPKAAGYAKVEDRAGALETSEEP